MGRRGLGFDETSHALHNGNGGFVNGVIGLDFPEKVAEYFEKLCGIGRLE